MKFIILTGYEKFEYAQQAVTLGVTDYLLKPVSAHKLIESIQKVEEKIDAETRQLYQINQLSEQLSSTQKLIQENFIYKLICGNINQKDIKVVQDNGYFPVHSERYAVALIYVRFVEQEFLN